MNKNDDLTEMKNSSFYPGVRYTLRHVWRTPGRVLLVAVVLSAFITAIGWMRWNIQFNDDKIDELYEQIIVEGSILPKNNTAYLNMGGGIIPRYVADELLQTGYVTELKLVAGFEADMTTKEYWESADRVMYKEVRMRAIESLDDYEHAGAKDNLIQYLEGYDESALSEPAPDEYNIILSDQMMQTMGVALGERIVVIPQMFEAEGLAKYYTIIGHFDDTQIDCQGMLPMRMLINTVGIDEVRYSQISYKLDPEKNRALDAFKEDVKDMLDKVQAKKITSLNNVVRDSELKQAIQPLEKRNALMRILYPVAIIIAVLILALTSVLTILASFKEAAVLRVLGTTKGQVGMILCLEQLLTYVIGLAVGMAVLILILGTNTSIILAGLLCAGCCIGGGFVASILCTAAVLKRKPLEYLQAKE